MAQGEQRNWRRNPGERQEQVQRINLIRRKRWSDQQWCYLGLDDHKNEQSVKGQ